jgi:hypothetical protein
MREPLPKSEFYGQFRVGRVQSVDKSAHRATVEFDEIDGMQLADMIVLATRQNDYSLMAQNTPVLCVIIDGRAGYGFVLGTFYTDDDAAPLSDDSQRAIASDDLRLGDPNAEKLVCIDGDQSDCGTLVFVPGSGGASLSYIPPGGIGLHVGGSTTIGLTGKITAGATKVKAK